MLHDALAWLSAPPDDPRVELAPLKQHLTVVIGAASVDAMQRLRLLELFQARIDGASAALKPDLFRASLPLPSRIRTVAQGLLDIHGLAAAATLDILRLKVSEGPEQARELHGHVERAIRNLAEQQQIALLMSTTAPSGLWTHVQDLVAMSSALRGTDAAGVENTLKGMLALAAVQAESFTAGELGFLIDYVGSYGTAVEVAEAPLAPVGSWYWIEEGRDLPPIAVARRPPPTRDSLLFYSCTTLSRIASQHLLQMSAGETPAELHSNADEPGYGRETLARAQKYWAAAPLRHSHRRPTHYRVRTCAGFPALWGQLRQESGLDDGKAVEATTEWMVLNESAGGYGLMHVTGPAVDLLPGEMLGLRAAPDDDWSVGLIRWVRSDNPEHLELGLEMLSPSAVPVRIVQQAKDAAESLPALLFPSVTGIDRDEILMMARGTARQGPFILIRESDGRLQVTQCEMQEVSLHSTRVELFGFRRDFAPE